MIAVIKHSFTAGVAMLIGSMPALAKEDENEGGKRDWEIVLGADGKYETKTEGADIYQFVPKAYVDITFKNRIFLSSEDGVGAYILRNDEREIGFGIKGGDDRHEDDDPVLLTGLPEIKKSLAASLFFAQELEDIAEIGADVTYDFGGAKGFLIDLSVSREIEISNAISLEFGVGASWADKGVLSALYGVSAEQAQHRGAARVSDPELLALSPTEIASSFYEAAADVTLGYQFSEKWSGGITADYTRFLGDVQKSVLTRRTSELEGTVFFRRRF